MCYAPITIKNNSKLYRPLLSKDLVQVPCGKCRECQISKENDWFVRIYYEWLRTKQVGGRTFFITLTYNNFNLPFLDTKKYRFLEPILQDFRFNRSSFRLNDEDYSSLISRIDRYEERYGCSADFIPDFVHSCFSDLHVKSFFKLLRQYLNNANLLKYSDLPLKYFVCCEYGDNKHRPHYHALVFVPKVIDSLVFLKYCRYAWSYRVKFSLLPDFAKEKIDFAKDNALFELVFSTPTKSGKEFNDWRLTYQKASNRWLVRRSYGFVNFSKDENKVERPVITDIGGCKYLTRYLNYYDNYLKDEGFEKLLDWIKLFPNLASVSGYSEVCSSLHELRQVFPFKRVSLNFGSLFAEQLNCLSENELKNYLVKNEVVIPTETKTYPIPSYIVRRLCYSLEDVKELPNKVSFFTPLGYHVFKDSFDLRLDFKVRQYVETIKVLRCFLRNDDILKFKELFGFDIGIIDSPCLDFDLRKLAMFDVVLNGVAVSHMGNFIDLSSMSASQILDNCYDIYINQLILRSSVVDSPCVLFDDLYYLHISHKTYLKRRCYNSLSQFVYYDRFLSALRFIRRTVLERDAKYQKELFTSETEVRNALNLFRYQN